MLLAASGRMGVNYELGKTWKEDVLTHRNVVPCICLGKLRKPRKMSIETSPDRDLNKKSYARVPPHNDIRFPPAVMLRSLPAYVSRDYSACVTWICQSRYKLWRCHSL